MKKPTAKILKLDSLKMKGIALPQHQADANELELGDVITLTVKARVCRTATTGENLFAFNQEVELTDPIVEMTALRKYAEIAKEKAAAEKAEQERKAKAMEKISGAKSKSEAKRIRAMAEA